MDPQLKVIQEWPNRSFTEQCCSYIVEVTKLLLHLILDVFPKRNISYLLVYFQGFEYSRSGNPTRNCLEKAVAALDGAKYCK